MLECGFVLAFFEDFMKKSFLLLPIILSLTACVAPIVDNNGKAVPVAIQTPAPALVIDARPVSKIDPNAPMYVCKIKPFIDTYQSENINRGKAKLVVQKQCLADNDEMFCQEKDIQCTEYK